MKPNLHKGTEGTRLELVVATQNPDKRREIVHALEGLSFRVLTHDDVGGWDEIEETGATLEENAMLKAHTVARVTGRLALADDTGLEVDALDGAPGVYSARFAGENATYADNVQKLLRALEGVERSERRARFRCVVAIVDPARDRATTVAGAVEGAITTDRRGKGGFGYDPVFQPAGSDRTFAELSLEEKRGISHRGRALQAARRVLEDWYGR